MLLPRSVKSRLTLLVAVGTLGALVVALSLLYVTLVRQMRAAIDDGLRVRGRFLAAAIRSGDVRVPRHEAMAQVYAADGRVLASSATLMPSVRLLSAAGVRAAHGESFHDVTIRGVAGGGGADEVRLLTRVVATDGDRLVVAVGASDEPIERARTRLLAVLLVAAPVLVLAVSGAAWAVAAAALRPVDVLTREAARIRGTERSRRLPDVPGDDEIARLARTLNAMLARLGEALEHERAFVDDASHELRTPLAVLRGELELALLEVRDPEAVEQSLRAALGEADRLVRLAEDLLVLARERAGTLVERRPTNVAALVGQVAERLARVVDADVVVHAQPLTAAVDAQPLTAAVDAARLEQVVTNLVRNSAAAGATTIEISVRRAGNGRVAISVADDGPGFPPQLLDTAFERFTTGDVVRTRTSEAGSGLGLAIVAAIVRAHGGAVTAGNDDPGGGARVVVELPTG